MQLIGLKVHPLFHLQQEDIKKRQSTAFANFILSEVLDTRVDARKWNLTFLRASRGIMQNIPYI